MLRTSTKFSLLCFAIAPLACGGDDTSQNDSDTGTSDTDGDDDDPDGPTDPDADATDPDADATDPDATDPDATDSNTETTDPDTSSGSESGTDGGCTPDDPCQVTDDCLPGQTCLGCICIGNPDGCEEYGDGEFGNCFADGAAACMNPAAACITDQDGTVGACTMACTEACDCPQPPKGAEDLLTCGDLNDDMSNECYLDCSGGAACPGEMFCWGGFICVFGEGGEETPPYGDCINGSMQCQDGFCLQAPGVGVCGSACNDVGDCPAAPPTGDAPLACDDLNADMSNECFLDCSGGEICPDGMECFMGFLCVWEEMEEPPPPAPNYGDCANNPPAVCDATEECIADANGAVCAGSDCADAAECPAAPPTGDAPVACGDIGGNGGTNSCYLDCSGGQTCPDGMVCSDGGYCQWTDNGMALDEDFEQGVLLPGWSVIDVDGHTPNAQVSYVTAAWEVTDELEPGNNFAAYSTSYYTMPEMADDWLITPPFVVGATAMLSWTAMTPDPMFPDGYEVRISTTGADPADFMTEPALFTVAAEEQNYTPHNVDLSAYAGETVYIAWRNNSFDAFVLLVDDVQVTD